MGRWGACARCGYEVRLAYVRIQNILTPIGLWCKGCGLSDKKVTISYKPGYIERTAHLIEFKNGRLLKKEIGIDEVVDFLP